MAQSLALTLVRHGETEWTERGLLHGRLDSPLSETGRRHARMTARRLAGERFDALLSSPRGRALETASIIGSGVALQPTLHEGFREMSYGWLEGKPLSLADPDGSGTLLLRPLVRMLMTLTGETTGDFAKRVLHAVESVQKQHAGGRVLIVTHWGVLSMLMAALFAGDVRSWRRYGPWTACGITELHSQNGAWRIARLNESEHLAKENDFE